MISARVPRLHPGVSHFYVVASVLFLGFFYPETPGQIIRLDEDICFKRVVPLPTITRVG